MRVHPYLIDLGHVTVPFIGEIHIALPTYGLLVACALLVAWVWYLRNAAREGLEPETAAKIAFWGLVAGLVGGKLGLVLVDLRWYLAHPGELLSSSLLTAAGVVWSAVLFGALGFAAAAKWHGVKIGTVLDAAALPLPAAQAIGRFGCLMAGCCYGGSCHLPWAVTYHSEIARQRSGVPLGVPLHPTPLYETLLAACVVLPLLIFVRRWRCAAGEVAAAYAVFYGTARFVIEMFRGDVMRGLWLGGRLSTSQIISLVLVPCGLIVWIRIRSKSRSERPRQAAKA